MTRLVRRVVAVSSDLEREELLESLMAECGGEDVVVHLESLVGGYARLRQLQPTAIMVLCEIDDVRACRLLSMLKADPAFAGVPVIIRATWHDDCGLERVLADLAGQLRGATPARPIN